MPNSRIEPLLQVLQQPIIEPRPRPARIHKRTIDVIGELQCADANTTSLWRSESDDHEIIGLLALDLEPLTRTTFSIRLISFLRDDSFESERVDLLEKCFAFALDVVERAHWPEFRNYFGEKFLPLEKRKAAQIEILERKQVECEKCRRQLDCCVLDVDRRAQTTTPLRR